MSIQLAKQLFDSRSKLVEQSRSITDKAEAEKRALTPTEQASYDLIDTDLRSTDVHLAEVLERTSADAAADESFRSLADRARVPGQRQAPDERSWLPSYGEYKKLQERAVDTTGAFIPVQYADRYFDQIRRRIGVLDAGPVLIPVEGAGSIKIPVVTSSVTVGSVAEGAAITPTDPGTASITLDPKKIAAMTMIDTEAVDDSKPWLLQVAANSLMRDMAVELDRQLVATDGTSGTMTGLLSQTGVTAGPSLGTNGASLSATAGFGFLADTLAAYEGANLDPQKAAWLMHSRTWASVRKIVDSQGRPIFSVDPVNPLKASIWGHPVYISNNVPITQTVGTSTDCSSILLADFSQVVVAVSRTVELQMSPHFAFNKDQLALRVTCRYDIGLPQPTAVVKTTGVRA